jgi:hypothetical protein
VTQKDPLALAVFGAALALLAGLLLYVLVFRAPEPAAPAQPGFVLQLQRFVAAIEDKLRDLPARQVPDNPVASRPALPKAASQARIAPPAPSAGPGLEAGRMWRYAVTVEPPVWRDITLTYRTQREGARIGVLTNFLYTGGKMNFHLGTFAPNHPSHENTRFPGFFMYAAYLKQPLTVGQQIAFGWHWQGKSAGSVKRFEGRVTGWEDLQLPGGRLSAARIEGTLSYLEDGQLRGRPQETFWYAPDVAQVVKIVREGVSPDEGSRRIVAELAEFR